MSATDSQTFAYLGPVGTFTEAALAKITCDSDVKVPYANVTAALDAVRKGEADFALVPIENSVEGVVARTLDEFLAFAVSNKKGVLLETKHPVISGNRIEEVVVEKIRATKGIEKIDVAVMSFSWFAIEKMKRIDPTIHTTFLMHKNTPWFQAKLSSSASIGPGINELREEPIRAERIKKLGRSLNVWTVDDDADIKLCEKLGVDILITNKPSHAREVLRYP